MFEVEITHDRPRVTGKGSRAIQAEIDAAIIAFLDDVADYGVAAFQQHVPVGDTMRLYEAVERSRVKKSPRGFNVNVGIAPITALEPGEDPEYPLYVEHGSGLFGPEKSLIHAEHGNVMVFTVSSNEWVIPHRRSGGDLFDVGPGQQVFTRYVQGQKAQHFSEKAEEQTDAYFKVEKRALAKVLSRIIASQEAS